MNKKTVIQTLEKIALYMELLGENPFKINAFRRAASVLESDPRSLAEIDDLSNLKGIGKGTGAVITDLLEKGESDLLNELIEKVPKSLVPLLQIPGLGGKRIAKLHAELGIDSIQALRAACLAQQVRNVPGFGKKTEENLLQAIEQLGTKKERIPIWQVEQIVDQIEAHLATVTEIERFSVAGSFRRREETSSDIDFVVATHSPMTVRERIISLLPIEEVVAAGDTKLSIVIDLAERVDVDFRFVTPAQFATALHHFTGSKEHNVRMRQLAKEHAQKISEYGIEQKNGQMLTFPSEEAFFNHFQLPFIPPSVRMDGKEVERSHELHQLVTLDDIRADFHMHTTWSDGGNSIREMAEACQRKGYTHLVITDHSQRLKVANGLTPDNLRQQIQEIRQINEEMESIHLFCGTEMDILPDGTLDYEDELLNELDFVIASIHSSFHQSQTQIMERLHAALEHPAVNLIAHPTGRLIGKRDGYDVDIQQFIKWAKKYNKLVELNANPRRLDLSYEALRLAQEEGVNVAINTDAHTIQQLNYMNLGVAYGQKAWLKKENVVNTWSVDRFVREIIQK